jgi:hypothetical protein
MTTDLIPNFELPATNDKKEPSAKGKGKNGDKTTNQVWANIGLPMAKGDGTKGFVNLPYGVPCDGMKESLPKIPDRATVQNKDYYDLRVNQNLLFQWFEKQMNALKPGDRVVLDLKVELYRVKEGENINEVDLSNNAFAQLLAGLTAPAQTPTQASTETKQ